MTIKLEHANITVASIETAVAFLTVAFPSFRNRGGGFMYGDEATGDWIHFGDDETYIALNVFREAPAAREVRPAGQGLNHLGFEVTDLDAMIERLEAAGYPLSPASVMTGHPFRRRAYFFDGNGFEWEFVEYASDKIAERNDYAL